MDIRNSQDEPEENDARALVGKGVRHAARRFAECLAVQQSLEAAEVVETRDLQQAIEVEAPGGRGSVMTVRFDPAKLDVMREEHRFPEWVISANIERAILAHVSDWELEEAESRRLIAHRDRPRPVQASGMEPDGL